MPTLAFILASAADPALPGTTGPDLTRYALVCAGLVLLVVGLGVALRRLAGRALGARAAKRSLALIDVLPLGGKQRLVVVRCYDRTFALGVGEKEVSLVSELDAGITPAREPLPGPADRKAFAQTLAALEQSPTTLSPLPPPLVPREIERNALRLSREGVLG